MLYDKKVFTYFLVCKVPSKYHLGVARVTVFQEIQPGVGFETGDFVKENLGGVLP